MVAMCVRDKEMRAPGRMRNVALTVRSENGQLDQADIQYRGPNSILESEKPCDRLGMNLRGKLLKLTCPRIPVKCESTQLFRELPNQGFLDDWSWSWQMINILHLYALFSSVTSFSFSKSFAEARFRHVSLHNFASLGKPLKSLTLSSHHRYHQVPCVEFPCHGDWTKLYHSRSKVHCDILCVFGADALSAMIERAIFEFYVRGNYGETWALCEKIGTEPAHGMITNTEIFSFLSVTN
jgi:hypothetical protein